MCRGYDCTYPQCYNDIFALSEPTILERLVAEGCNMSRYHYIFYIKFVDFASQMPYFNQFMGFPAILTYKNLTRVFRRISALSVNLALCLIDQEHVTSQKKECILFLYHYYSKIKSNKLFKIIT